MTSTAAHSHPPPLPRRRWTRILAYAPLFLLVAEIPWFFVSALFLLFLVGDAGRDVRPAQERALTVFFALPADIGLLIALTATVLGWARRRVDWICLILGFVGCAVFVGLDVWNCIYP